MLRVIGYPNKPRKQNNNNNKDEINVGLDIIKITSQIQYFVENLR